MNVKKINKMIFKNEQELDFSLEENQAEMQLAFETIALEQGNTYGLIIDGEIVKKERTLASLNPANHKEVLGYAAQADQNDIEAAMEGALEAFSIWKKTSIDERIAIGQKMVTLLRKNRFLLNAWIVLESGKNWSEADGEVCETIDFFNAYCQAIEELDEGLQLETSISEQLSCHYIPIGVGVIISPWNFPLALMAGMVASAILSGNTVIIKPAQTTPIVAYKFVELLMKAGVYPGVCQLLSGTGSEIGDQLILHPKTRFINFTGSKHIGLRIQKMAASVQPSQIWMKRVVAEMGGKNAIIVDSSANLQQAAKGIIASAFSFQGQKCSACSRVFILHDRYETLLAILISELKQLTIGTGRENCQFGPVHSQKAYDKIVEYIELGKKEGRVIYGGGYDDSKGYFVEPTMVEELSFSSKIAKEEIFGPVLALFKVNSFEEGIQRANETEYGLTGAVFSQNEEHILLAKQEFYVGNLYVNRKSTGAVVRQHPFGGFNMSGTAAKTGTKDYVKNFLQLQSIAEAL